VRLSIIVFISAATVACQRAPAHSQEAAGSAKAPVKAASSPAQTPAAPPRGTTLPAQPPAETPPAAASAPVVKPVPLQLPDVIARIDGEPISRGEFERAVRNVEARAGRTVPADQRDQVYRGILDELIAFKLVLQEARARSLTIAEQEVDARIGEIRKQFKTEDEFQKALTARQMTLEQLKGDTRTEMTVNRTLESEIGPRAAVQAQELETYYKENPDQFKQPERLRASHILIAANETATPDVKKAARAQAEEVLTRARAGEDFAALAKQFSKDSSAQNGGDLNYFPRGQMVPAFDKVAFALKPGEISDVVETPFGYHIIKATDYKPAGIVPLSEVSTRLESFLRARKEQDLANAFVRSLRAKYKVEVLI
jgi:peptidyl-prolyl cis-trans isomerase C